MFSEDNVATRFADLHCDSVPLPRNGPPRGTGRRVAVRLQPPSPAATSPRDYVLTWPPSLHDTNGPSLPTPSTAASTESIYYTSPSTPTLTRSAIESTFSGSESDSEASDSDSTSSTSTSPSTVFSATPIIAQLAHIPRVWPAGHRQSLLDILLGRTHGQRLTGLARLRRIAPPPLWNH